MNTHAIARQSPEERLASKLDKSAGPDGCWVWHGGVNNKGYGEVSLRRVKYYTHRLAWILANGPVPDGLCVCHRCDNPPCCNPAHLFLGTLADNNRDMFAKGRNSNTGAPGEQNGGAKLTANDVVEMVNKRAAGAKLDALATEYGVTRGIVTRICGGKLWRHIQRPRVGPRVREPGYRLMVIERIASGESRASVARSMNLSPSTVTKIVNEARP